MKIPDQQQLENNLCDDIVISSSTKNLKNGIFTKNNSSVYDILFLLPGFHEYNSIKMKN